MNFASDNQAPVAPEILAALHEANEGAAASYGADAVTEKLRRRACELFETELAIYPVGTGTAANALALATLVKPFNGVICYEEAHIATDECGAPEFYMGGAKLLTLPSADGKILPGQISAVQARALDGGVHHVMPEAVSITQATEWGTVYAPDEIAALSGACRLHGLSLHMDGARFGNAVAHLGVSPAEASWRAGVEVLSFGATKNGALAAEAVIFFNPALAAGFERRRKRGGQLWSKMRFLSAQLLAYIENGLWLRHAAHANHMATTLQHGLSAIPGVRILQKVQANELFVAMPEPLVAHLEQAGARFYRWIEVPGIDNPVIRLVTAWCTTPAEVTKLLAAARAAPGA